MVCIVKGSDEQVAALQQASANDNWLIVNSVAAAQQQQGDAFFYLGDDAATQSLEGFSCPVFINSTISTLQGCQAKQLVGINGWPFFLQKSSWELSGTLTPAIQQVLEALGKTAIPAPDQPGFISARAIAMIINEAYFALEDEVSSKQDIDTAMKLGTNYPYGPFEWATLLGIQQVYQLLETLSQTDGRCAPAPLLKKEALG